MKNAVIALLLFGGIVSGFYFYPRMRPHEDLPKKGPKLAVVVVFDQMRGDYLPKWKEHFVEGGFKRLLDEGAFFTNCHYPYSDTYTAAGHTTLLTGTTPSEHGIISNEWFDRKTGKPVTSTSGERGPTPLRRRRETLGDALLAATNGKSKIAGLSIKERAALLMAALRAQMVYALSPRGLLEIPVFYRDQPAPWAKRFNDSKKAHSYVDQTWDRCRTDLDYDKIVGPDDQPWEAVGYNQGRTFPHPTPSYGAVECSPFGNKILAEVAKLCVENEKMGQRDVPDLLCVSFSSNDIVGHCYGPNSQEVFDITLQSDLMMKDLLDFLDAKVGKGNYVLALAADHGICPQPEDSVSRGKEAERVSHTLLTTQTEAFLNERYLDGKSKLPWVEAEAIPWVYLNQKVIKAQGLKPSEVEEAVAEFYKKQPGVLSAYTRTQVSKPGPLADPLAEQVRLSFHPENTGDVIAVLKPNNLMWNIARSKTSGAYSTTHGSPHPYDTHIPMLFFGAGIKPGWHDEKVTPLILTPTMAKAIGIAPPSTAKAAIPAGIFEK